MSFWSQKTAAIGQKKYGLVKKQGSALAPKSAAVAAMFGGDDDAPRDAKQEVAQQMRDLGAAQRRRAAASAAQAAAVDPSIYDYDGVYDQMKEDERKKISARSGLSNTNHSKPGSRYVGALKQAAKVREREFDRVYERQLLKEQAEEKEAYGDTERFVTAAYKQQLQESRKWDAEDKAMDAVEERTSVATSGMAGFYSNLLTRNVAAGADVEKNAVSSYTHGSRRNAVVDEGPASAPVVKQEEDAAASALARFEAGAPPTDAETRRARAAFAAARGYDAVAERLAKVEEEEAPAETAPEAPVVPAVAPRDAAAAARERFLARKRARNK